MTKTETSNPDSNEELTRVVSYALYQQRKADAVHLKRGLNKHTEHYAYPLILPMVSERNQTLALRVAGLITHHQIPQSDVTFGAWCAAGDASSLDTRITRLVNLSQEQAVTEISRLMTMVGSKKGLNWYDLARTLRYWGNGVSDGSLKARQRIPRAYFGAGDQTVAEIDKEETVNDILPK